MPYNILSFNGGGIRGLMSFQILLRLVEARPHFLGATSLLAGTSAGAGIAGHIAAGGKVDADALRFQTEASALFFADPKPHDESPAYDINAYRDTLEFAYRGKRMADLLTPVVMTGFEVTPGLDWDPVLFNNVLPGFDNVLVSDAVAASGCMPGMFSAYFASNGRTYVDGGFYDHDPTMAAIAAAVNTGVALSDINVIDIGTGLMPQGFSQATQPTTWGAGQWQTCSEPADYPTLLVNGTPSPVLNLSLNGTFAGITLKLAQMMLPRRCVSLNPVLDSFIAENDVAGIPALQQAASLADLTEALALIDGPWSS
jgi:uncharacterized protein